MISKPLRVANKPFKSMNTNTSKERNFYTQGQQRIARILLAAWLLAIGSPESTLATPKHQMTQVIMTSPGDPSLASAPPLPGGALELPPDSPGVFWGDSIGSSPSIDTAPQQRMGQEAAPDEGSDLLRTSPKVSPVSEHLPFEARGGESVRFSCQQGQWHAEVSSHIGAFSRRSVLPVVCSQGLDIASSLEVLSNYPSWYSQRQIHVLDRNVCPTLGEVVYVGELGLRGGGEGEASGSGEPQGEVSDPAEQGNGEQSEQAMSLQLASQAVGSVAPSSKCKALQEPDLVPRAKRSKLIEPFTSQVLSTSQAPSPAEQPATTATTPLRISSSAKGREPYRPQLATRASDFGLARRDQSAESKGPTPLELDQIEAKRLKEQIDQLYPKLSEATPECYSQIVDELITHLVCLLDLKKWIGAQDSNSAQDYIARLREVHATRWGATAYGIIDKQLTALLEQTYVQALNAANSDLLRTKTPASSIRLAKILAQLAVLDQEQGDKTRCLAHYTDAAILYQRIVSVCETEIEDLDKQAAKALQDQKQLAYSRLVKIKATMLARAKGEETSVVEQEEAASQLQAEIEQDKAELQQLRAYTRPLVDTLVNDLEAALSKQESEKAVQAAEEKYIKASKALFENIAKVASAFLARLYRESEQTLGPAPCKYAVMGLGSMALQQMTPYSDLEFAILMEDVQDKGTAKKWRRYFRKLTHLVHFRVINLGETIIPTSKYQINLNHLGKRGTNLDLGGKTPLGRKDKPYELIQPVSGMVYYLHNEEDKMEHMDKLLPYILESTCYVYGDSSLHERYVAEKRTFLLDSQDTSGKPAYQKRALKKLVEGVVEMDYKNPGQYKNLEGDLEDFAPRLGSENAGRLYNVKEEIYRLPDRLLYRLAMYYGILPTSGWDAVDQLSQRDIIGVGDKAQQAAHHLHYVVSFATMLRLQTYLHHGQQFEKATMLSKTSQEAEIQQAVQAAFTLPASSLQAGGSLFKYYYTAIPLHSTMKEFFRKWDKAFLEQLDLEPELIASLASRGLADKLSSSWRNREEETFFQTAPFYDSSAETRIGIHQRLLQHKKVKDSYEEALAIQEQRYGPNHPAIASTLNNLGNAWSVLGDAGQAVSYYDRALAIDEQSYQETPNHPEIAGTLNNLGNAWGALGDARQAVSFYQRALAMWEQVYQETPNHPEIAGTLNNLGSAWGDLGDAKQAVSFYERALAMKEQVYQETPNHPSIAIALNNLGGAWRNLGDARQAISFYDRALAIYEQYYKETPNHPDIASTLHNLGAAWRDLGDARQAVSFLERALAMKEQVYQETPNHPDLASTLGNLGNVWSDLGDAKQAVSYLERALAIYEQVYKETPNHPDIARALNNLGSAWSDLGDERKAVSFYERALAIYEQVYGPNHPHIAQILNNLGKAWRDLGDARQAVSFFERALAIREQVYKETPNHPDIASTLRNLGIAWGALGEASKTVSCLERALAIYKQVHGPNHPDVAMTLMGLELAHRALGSAQVESPASILIKACREGDSESVASIPISSLSKDLYDNEGNPLISWMAQHEMTATLEQVLALGWNPNLPNTNQVYPLHYGAMKDPRLVQLLLPYADPFVQTAKGSTPAMIARSKGKMQALKLLLPAIPDLCFQDPTSFESSYTTFKQHFMEASGHADAPSLERLAQVFTLACHFKDWELAQAVAARHNLRPILSQVAQQYPGAAKSLLVRVDSFTEACREGKDALAAETAGQFTFEKDLCDSEGNSLISWMAQHEMTATLEKVLALGWNPNFPNTSQVYPLHYGAMRSVAVTRLLLQAGAYPFVQTAKESTPAMVAKKKENLQTLALLLPAQAMLSFEDLAAFEASYQAYKEHLTPSAADDKELLVALELALQLGDVALLQSIGTSQAEGLLSQLAQKYPLGEDAIQVRFATLLSLVSS